MKFEHEKSFNFLQQSSSKFSKNADNQYLHQVICAPKYQNIFIDDKYFV